MPILLAAATALALLFTSTVQAQAGIANVGLTADTDTHWCGAWAGKPNPRDLPQDQLLPQRDYKKLFFVEPQLTSPPFRPLMGSEPKVQIPKIWGNDNVRIALMSFSQQKPVQRVYSSSKSRWADFREALDKVRETCLVKEGTGGAYLVPPSPGLTQSTLVVYVYTVGSRFDFVMNYYMSEPYPLDPSGFKDDNMLPADAQNVPPPGYLSATAAAAAATATRPPASANAPPRIAAAPAGYTYLGCYTEVLPGRTLNASTLIRPQTTVLGCAADCGEDSEYFGVEFGTQCFCGSSLAVGSVAVNEGCSTACAGNATEVCGGVNLLSVYRKQTQSS